LFERFHDIKNKEKRNKTMQKRQKLDEYSIFRDPQFQNNSNLILEFAKQLDEKTLWGFCVASSKFHTICNSVPELKERYERYIRCSHRRAALRRIFDCLENHQVSKRWRAFLATPYSLQEMINVDRLGFTITAWKMASNLRKPEINFDIWAQDARFEWTFVLDEKQCLDHYVLRVPTGRDLSHWNNQQRFDTFQGVRPGVFTRAGDYATGTKWMDLSDMICELIQSN
jgi:hypothetical protein